MGSASSRLSSSFTNQRLSKAEVDPLLLERFDFDRHADDDGTVSIGQLMTAFSQQTDAYLSYSWGYRKKHQRLVSGINELLVGKGLRTFLDKESVPINVAKQLYAAINNASCIVLFLSQEYISKLSSPFSNDCMLEFEYIMNNKSLDRIVPVLLDVSLLKERRPASSEHLGRILSSSNPIDLTRCCLDLENSDLRMAIAGREIFNRVVTLCGGSSLQSVYSKLDFDFVFERHWHERDYRVCRTLVGHSAAVRSAVELRFGEVVSVSDDKRLIIWDVDAPDTVLNDAIIKPRKVVYGHVDTVHCVVQLADERLCSGGSDGAIKTWSLDNIWTENGSCDRTMRGHTRAVTALVQLRDGRLCSSSEDCSIRVWDLSCYRCIHAVQELGNEVTHLVQLQDSSLCSSSADGTIRLWDTVSLQCIDTIAAHEGAVTCVLELQRTHPSALCTCSEDRTIKVWDRQTLRDPKVLHGHWAGVLCVTELRDGRLVSASRDMKVKIWHLSHCKKSSFWSWDDYCEQTLLGHCATVWWVLQLRDGRVVSASDDNNLKVWG